MPSRRRSGALFEMAADWLAARPAEELGAETLLRDLPPAAGWQVTVVRQGDAIQGVSVVTPGRRCHLAGDDPAVVDVLMGLARRVQPVSRVAVAGGLKPIVRERLLDTGPIGREHDQLVMVCTTRPRAVEGRWATADDLPALRRHARAYDRERGVQTAGGIDAEVASRSVAVLERGGSVVAVAKTRRATPRYATVFGSFTTPGKRRRGLGALVTGFAVREALKSRPAVHLVVDDDNEAAIALYRSLGFEEAGRCYVAYPG